MLLVLIRMAAPEDKVCCVLIHLCAGSYPSGPQGSVNGVSEDRADLRYSSHQSELQRPQIILASHQTKCCSLRQPPNNQVVMVAETLEEGFEYSCGVIVSKAFYNLGSGEVEKRM